MVIPDDFEQNRQRAQDAVRSADQSARRFAAAVAGAVEGFFQAFEEHRVAEEAKESIRNAGEIARAVTEEGRTQAQTPEMQEIGHGLKKAGLATADAARTATNAVKGAASSAADAVTGTASDATGAVKDTAGSVASAAHDAADAVRRKVDDVKQGVEHAKEEVKVRAEAVAETSRRARVAPGVITTELKGAYRAWLGGIVTAVAMGFVMAIFAVVTLVVLTIALVVGLNELVGDPAGTWLVALLYAVVIVAAYFVMRSRREAATRESERHMDRVGDEIRHVGAPVRSAFTGRGRAGF